MSEKHLAINTDQIMLIEKKMLIEQDLAQLDAEWKAIHSEVIMLKKLPKTPELDYKIWVLERKLQSIWYRMKELKDEKKLLSYETSFMNKKDSSNNTDEVMLIEQKITVLTAEWKASYGKLVMMYKLPAVPGQDEYAKSLVLEQEQQSIYDEILKLREEQEQKLLSK